MPGAIEFGVAAPSLAVENSWSGRFNEIDLSAGVSVPQNQVMDRILLLNIAVVGAPAKPFSVA